MKLELRRISTRAPLMGIGLSVCIAPAAAAHVVSGGRFHWHAEPMAAIPALAAVGFLAAASMWCWKRWGRK